MAAFTPPVLDDRRYEELRNELVRRIPVHSREWTDHNASDPGIALLEVFAWLATNLLYRMNRAPEKAQLEFLRLLNLPPRPAAVARATVRFSLPKDEQEPVVIPFGGAQPRTKVRAPDGVNFQVVDELSVLPVVAQAFVKQSVPDDVEVAGELDVQQLLEQHFGEPGQPQGDDEQTQPRIDNEKQQPKIERYRTIALPPVEGGVPPAVTALANTVDDYLWIALLAPEPLVKNLESAELAEALLALRRTISGRVLSLGARVDDELCGALDHVQCPEPGGERPRYPVLWEIATGRFRFDEPKVDQALYKRLTVRKDDSDGLIKSGVVRLELPAERALKEPEIGNWTGDQFENGDADLLGVGELPPRLDLPKLEARVVTWIRCTRVNDTHPDIRVRSIDGNMVDVEQAVTAPGELLGYGNGKPNQVVTLSKKPVLPESMVPQVKEASGWVTWRAVDDLLLSMPNEPDYELDADTGEIRFGDGIHGRMPRPGEMIRCLSYRYGGGALGNVAAEAINRVEGQGPIAKLKATNPYAAAGGRDAETVEEARRRVPQMLRHRDRAVTETDFRNLAMETPGVHVGRVEVLPRHKPHERVEGVPGVVTLLVLPAYDPLHPDEPTPDRVMQRRVCEHLESRRLVTTELYVTPPEYVRVWVSVAVDVERDYGVETVRNWVQLAVRQHLAPLPPYGPDGNGWPFGRDVRERDIEAAVLRVEGVRLVNDAQVQGVEVNADGRKELVSRRVGLAAWQLPVVRNVQVSDGDVAEEIDRTGDPSAPPLEPRPKPPGEEGAVTVPVPVEQEEC